MKPEYLVRYLQDQVDNLKRENLNLKQALQMQELHGEESVLKSQMQWLEEMLEEQAGIIREQHETIESQKKKLREVLVHKIVKEE